LVGGPGMEHPVVCLSTDVATTVHVATSVEASAQLCCRDALPGRDMAGIAVPFPVAMGRLALRTFWLGTRQVTWLRSVTEGDTFVAVSWRVLAVHACLGWPTALLRVCACLLLAGLVVGYKPTVRSGFVVLPRLFAWCLALEGLSHSEVVSIAWDPHPWEPLRERSGLRACSSWQPTGRTLELRGKRVVLGMGPQLGQAAMLRAFVCFCGSSVSLFHGGEAGARLASIGRGRRVPLLAASGGGLVAIVVAMFSSVICCPSLHGGYSLVVPTFPWASLALDLVEAHPPPYFLQLGAPRHGSLVSDGFAKAAVAPCVVSSSGSECCELLYPSELRVVICKFSGSVGDDANFRVYGGGPGGRVVIVGMRLPCKIRVRAIVSCSCCCIVCMASVVTRCVRAMVARLAVDSLAVIFLMWRMVAGKSRCGAPGCLRRIWVCVPLWLREPACGVAFTSVGLFPVELVEALRHLPMVVVSLVLAGCEL
ncbi:hypothetical protein Taro_041995, partial [Colocasia esculenta]|nr:hypothetical protein [Colocasia esculenta]